MSDSLTSFVYGPNLDSSNPRTFLPFDLLGPVSPLILRTPVRLHHLRSLRVCISVSELVLFASARLKYDLSIMDGPRRRSFAFVIRRHVSAQVWNPRLQFIAKLLACLTMLAFAAHIRGCANESLAGDMRFQDPAFVDISYKLL
ncbi:hypothetical protein B0H11DRAFT_2240246 [Mycena galericulata]|nr:hypothetical protein B0H11DRAFT_2240246 [Mycena galericulata]